MKHGLLTALGLTAALCAAAAAPALAESQPGAGFAPRAVIKPLTTTGILTKTYSVIVNVDGTLAVGPSGATSDDFGNATAGIYEVIFPSAVNACVFNATIGDAFADSPAAGLVNVTRRATTIDGVFVQTFDPNGTRRNHPFHLIVTC